MSYKHNSTKKKRQLKLYNALLSEEINNTLAYYNSLMNKNKNKIYDYRMKLRKDKNNKQSKEQIASLTYRNSLLESHVEHIKFNIPKNSVKFSSSQITFNKNSPPRNLTRKKKELFQNSSKYINKSGNKSRRRN